MRDLIDLERYPLDQPRSTRWVELVDRCRSQIAREGLLNLPGFVRGEALGRAVEELKPALEHDAFTHARRHNIYFKEAVEGLTEEHPALTVFETSNRTICADQMDGTAIIQIYEWPALGDFLAAIMEKPVLFTMDDPLARVNVMAYSAGQAFELALRSIGVHHDPSTPGPGSGRRL